MHVFYLYPPALTSAEYAAAYDDTKLNGVPDGDHERDEIAEFWVAEAGTVAETGTWLQAAMVLVKDRGTIGSLSDSARLFALLGMANADAVIMIWTNKAANFTWRPTTAIREGELDGNAATIGDPLWATRFGAFGTSPEYPSGTSVFAGTAEAVLAFFFGRDDISFEFEADGAPDGARAYDSFSGAAAEAGRSRIYQGVHFEFSNQEGLRLGRGIAGEITSTQLRRNRLRR